MVPTHVAMSSFLKVHVKLAPKRVNQVLLLSEQSECELLQTQARFPVGFTVRLHYRGQCCLSCHGMLPADGTAALLCWCVFKTPWYPWCSAQHHRVHSYFRLPHSQASSSSGLLVGMFLPNTQRSKVDLDQKWCNSSASFRLTPTVLLLLPVTPV